MIRSSKAFLKKLTQLYWKISLSFLFISFLFVRHFVNNKLNSLITKNSKKKQKKPHQIKLADTQLE